MTACKDKRKAQNETMTIKRKETMQKEVTQKFDSARERERERY